jgi:hypothetical protein
MFCNLRQYFTEYRVEDMGHKNEFSADPPSPWESVEKRRLEPETINQNPAAGPGADRPQSQEISYASNP